MPQCIATTKNGDACQIPARNGSKYCHVHLRQRFWRKISLSAIGVVAFGVLGFVANVTGILGYFGYVPPRNTQTEPPALPSPTSTSLPTPTAIPALFPTPSFYSDLPDFAIAGYSKQTSMVRDSKGKITLFIKNNMGELAIVYSTDGGRTWSLPISFDSFPPPGGPQISAVIDSADRIHVVWGHAPEAGNAEYGLLYDNEWLMRETIGTGVFARDIAVDSANHPHVVWTNTDLFHITYNGQKWTGPTSIAQGAWHPDVHVNQNDDLIIFANDGGFYPTPGVSVFALDNINVKWNIVSISTSPFWSGGVSAALDSEGNIYLVWIGSSTAMGGNDQVFFSRYVDGEWQTPFQIGEVNASAGSTGQEAPSVAFDSNDVFYVFWRGYNTKNRPVIFARAFASEISMVSDVTSGWSPIINIDNRNASDVGWPSVADVWLSNRVVGVDIVWDLVIGTGRKIQYSHVVYP
jgi:hypothetical protein